MRTSVDNAPSILIFGKSAGANRTAVFDNWHVALQQFMRDSDFEAIGGKTHGATSIRKRRGSTCKHKRTTQGLVRDR
jgi:hypothetical protein